MRTNNRRLNNQAPFDREPDAIIDLVDLVFDGNSDEGPDRLSELLDHKGEITE